MKKTIYSSEHGKVIEHLVQARVEANLTQAQVAEKLGKTQSFVSKVEAGQRRVDVVLLRELATIYSKPIEFFLA
ncbi:helix-turn-helix transcriptional regulator [bacterium]|nr:helix-turn-helix transcriptional regulator [bacterium]